MPATVPVHVLCDQGLGSRDLWAQIVALGWHPCLRYPPHVTFQPEGQSARVPVRTLITGPGGLRLGTGWAFRDPPREGTLIVLHAYGPTQPWVLLTDTRYNPVIRRFYRRLCAVGKPKKVALIAAMRKLLTILNAMIKARKPWIEDHFPLLET